MDVADVAEMDITVWNGWKVFAAEVKPTLAPPQFYTAVAMQQKSEGERTDFFINVHLALKM